MSPGIVAIEYALPPGSFSLQELADAELLASSPSQLHDFGFNRCYISNEPADELAIRAAAALIKNADVEPDSIDLLLYASAVSQNHQLATEDSLSGFNYPAAKIQYELGLTRANVAGISQAGCTGLNYAIKFAADILQANDNANRILCVSADVLPKGSKREILYNVISDGACALLVERRPERNRIIAQRSITKGYYWDCISRKNEIMAAYFPTAKNLFQELLRAAECDPKDLRMVLPHNVSLRSWEILLDLVGVRKDQLFSENIPKKGHVIGADNWINLKDAMTSGVLKPGDKLLAFNFGFGANWTATLIEY
jgi:3-oxoacyl-[acyl-carrier-protein] synthase-3